ncbi:hypothetical protein PQX77_013377 [Marasmius sp. AFHP31]|nr:hypothetical protein PQX77_013377 [Marasmius sp. AFHP31]
MVCGLSCYQESTFLSLRNDLLGAYAVLYGVCISVLRSRRLKLPHYYVHVGAATSLFVLATVSLFLSTLIIVHTAKLSLVGLTFVERDDIANSVTSQQMLLIPSAHLSLVVANFIVDPTLVRYPSFTSSLGANLTGDPFNPRPGATTPSGGTTNKLSLSSRHLFHEQRSGCRNEHFIHQTPPSGTVFPNTTYRPHIYHLHNVHLCDVIFECLHHGSDSWENILPRPLKALMEPDYQRMYQTDIAMTHMTCPIPALSGRVDRPPMVLSGRMLADEVEVLEASSDEGAFFVDITMMQFQERMRVSDEVWVDSIARGRMCRLALCISNEKWRHDKPRFGAWYVSLTLLENSPPTWIGSQLLIPDARLPLPPLGETP